MRQAALKYAETHHDKHLLIALDPVRLTMLSLGRQKDLKTTQALSPPVLIDTFNFQGAVTEAYWPWLCNQGAGSQRLSNERVH